MINKRFNRPSFRLTSLILAFTLLGLGFHWFFKTKTSSSHHGRPAGFAIPVEAARATPETIHEEVMTVGSLEAGESVMIRPEIAGRVVTIDFQEGQKVSQGDLLVKLDDSTYTASVAESEASLAFSEAQNHRQSSLYKQNYTSGGKKDEATAKFRVAEAILQQRKATLEKTKILAPFNGSTGLRKISPGDYVQAGQDIVTLVNLDPIKVRFSLPEIYLLQLKEGQKIELTSDVLPGKNFTGEIFAIYPVVNENGRNLELRGKLSNPTLLLRPGLFVRVKVILATRENALMIPEEAIVPQGNHHFVYKIEGDKVKLTQVRIGIRRQGKVEIRQGLALSDQVVTAGQIKISDGLPVKIVSGQGSKEAS